MQKARRRLFHGNFRLIGVVMVISASSLFVAGQEADSDALLLPVLQPGQRDSLLIRIQVYTPTIIRVSATSEKTFSLRPNLIVEQSQLAPSQWTCRKEGEHYLITTSQLVVKVDAHTGRIGFYTRDQIPLLQEIAGGGKSIMPVHVLGEDTYHIRQLFAAAEDEAFYGLGQHQNAVMNYRGHDVDLWQYNIVAAVPFLISSKKYGILWDNYSRTKFGDIREYLPLTTLPQFDEQGRAGGLKVEYFRDSQFKSILLTRKENRIEHQFLDRHDPYPENFDAQRGSIRWSGMLAANQSGVHKLRLYASSYVRMWLNGELVVDAWRQNWLPWTHVLQLNMETGKLYPIKIEWVPQNGYLGLQYLPPATEELENRISLWSEVGDQIDYYFIYGNDLDQVLAGYRYLTGKAPLLPRWALGFWQSRERYRTQAELLEVVKEYRRRRIPLDNIVLDWFYWPEARWGEHLFDMSRFPDPGGMVEELHTKLHTHIMISVWPKFYIGTEHFNQFFENDWLYLRNVELGQRDWVGPGYVSTFYDPYSEGARNLFWQQIKNRLFGYGFDAWWLDSTEPDIQSNLSREESLLRMHPTALGSAARYANTYSLLHTKGVYENLRLTDPERRVFILTRSAFAGQQKYAAATWSGDVAARWYDLRAQISAGLNFCLSGLPYWTMDIGGFAVEPRFEKPNASAREEWRELYTRWFQLGTFCPLFRAHGQFPHREIFNIAPESHPAYRAMVKYDQLRYRLLPYIYSLVGRVYHDDYTMMRALVMDFGHDPQVLNIDDQFMFGPALLINPVTTYKARTRAVYLPEGCSWYDIHTGRYFTGGQIIQARAPYEDIPIYVKAGSIVPIGPEIQYTDEKPADPIQLWVYTGQDGSFTLYEDEGINYHYERGEFTQITFSWREDQKALQIGARQGSFPGMLQTRCFAIYWLEPGRPRPLDFTTSPDTTVTYQGNALTIKMK